MPRNKRPLPGEDFIIVYSTYADKDTPNADYLTYLAIKRAASGLLPAPRYTGGTPGLPIEARVALGRWLVSCEDCRSGVVIEPDVPVYMCPKCDRSGLWRPMVMPPERERIEEILLLRPGFREANVSRFWLPGESVDKLIMDNAIRDVPIPGDDAVRLKDDIAAVRKLVTDAIAVGGVL